MRRSHQDTEQNRQERPDRKQRVGNKRNEHQLPDTLLRCCARRIRCQRALRPVTQRERKRATEQREREAEEQRESRDLLQLRDLQIFDVGDDEE